MSAADLQFPIIPKLRLSFLTKFLFFTIHCESIFYVMAKNIIVSNRLPIRITKVENSYKFIATSGGLATGMKSVHEHKKLSVGRMAWNWY